MERFIPVYQDCKVSDRIIYVPEKNIRYVEFDSKSGDMFATIKEVPFAQYAKKVVVNGIVANGAHQIKQAYTLTMAKVKKNDRDSESDQSC